MIVFRRKKREQVVINGNIVVTIMNIRGTRVSLGIEAPDGVRILRTELFPHTNARSVAVSDTFDATPAAISAAT